MMRSLGIAIAIFAFGLCSVSQAAQHRGPAVPKDCRKGLSRAIPDWSLASLRDGIAGDSKDESAYPRLVRGDFNGDGLLDTALVLTTKLAGRPDVAGDSDRRWIAFCLASPFHAQVVLVKDPYCDDYIGKVGKGAKVQDVDTAEVTTMKVDAVDAECDGRAGAVYFLKNGNVLKILNSD